MPDIDINTPWGQPDHVTHVAEGIKFYTTPSHGGYHLSAERMKSIPAQLRGLNTFGKGQWFEEDCEWAIVAVTFPELFPASALPQARSMIQAVYNVEVAA